ncbi:MAG: protein kinase [Polyangiales bacterium]
MNGPDGLARPGFLTEGVPASVGRYELIAPLGKGGMAGVYLARHVGSAGFERLAAVKLMHRNLTADEDFVTMFLDEARVAARLHHPNVVAIIDLGAEDGELYMVMDYVEGDTLAAVQRTAINLHRAVPLGIVLRVTLDALAGLDAAHELKGPDGAPLHLIHRDATPQNILIGVDGAARLVDFGIARAERRLGLTSVGVLKGKAPFMAPEQLEGRAIDRRADVFHGRHALETITLWRCFPQRAGADFLNRLLKASYCSLREIAGHVPEELDAICAKALAYHPQDRYPTAAAFADAIERTFKSEISTHRQVGQFMSVVAAEKVARERAAIRALNSADQSGAHDAPRPRRNTPSVHRAGTPMPFGDARPRATVAAAAPPPPPSGGILDVLAPGLPDLEGAPEMPPSEALYNLPALPDLEAATAVSSGPVGRRALGSALASPRKSSPPPAPTAESPFAPPERPARMSTLAPGGLPHTRAPTPALGKPKPSPTRAPTPVPVQMIPAPAAVGEDDAVRRIQEELVPAEARAGDALFELPTQTWSQAKERPSVAPRHDEPTQARRNDSMRVPTRPGARTPAPAKPVTESSQSGALPFRAPTRPGPRTTLVGPPLPRSAKAGAKDEGGSGFLRVPTRPGVKADAPREVEVSFEATTAPVPPSKRFQTQESELATEPDEVELPQEPPPVKMIEPAPMEPKGSDSVARPLPARAARPTTEAKAGLPLTMPLPSERPPEDEVTTDAFVQEKRLPKEFVAPPRPPIITPMR